MSIPSSRTRNVPWKTIGAVVGALPGLCLAWFAYHYDRLALSVPRKDTSWLTDQSALILFGAALGWGVAWGIDWLRRRGRRVVEFLGTRGEPLVREDPPRRDLDF